MPEIRRWSWGLAFAWSALALAAAGCHGVADRGAQALAAQDPPSQGPQLVAELGTVAAKERPVSRSARAWFGRARVLHHLTEGQRAATVQYVVAYADSGNAQDVGTVTSMPMLLACDASGSTCCYAHGTGTYRLGVATTASTRDFANEGLAAVFDIGIEGRNVTAIALDRDGQIVMLEGLVSDNALTRTDAAVPGTRLVDLVVAHEADRFAYCYTKPDGTSAVRWLSRSAAKEHRVARPLSALVPGGGRFLGHDADGNLFSIEADGVHPVMASDGQVTRITLVESGANGAVACAQADGKPSRVFRITGRVATEVASPGEVLEIACQERLWAAVQNERYPSLTLWDAASNTWTTVDEVAELRVLTPDGAGLAHAHATGKLTRWSEGGGSSITIRLPVARAGEPKIVDLCTSRTGSTARFWILALVGGVHQLYRW